MLWIDCKSEFVTFFARVGLLSDDILNTIAISVLTEIGIVEIFDSCDLNGKRCKGVRVKPL